MKNFLIKSAVIFIFAFILIRFTLISLINDYETKLSEKLSSSTLIELKSSVMNEIKKSNSKDRILYEADAKVISVFLRKILTELNLK